ncbi:BT1 family-domain-containing protein [Pavlovales sp. CCMP2436]|nr:BT1 family-domain-containing protein [Pavlovales sp. CCMP2436]
MRRPPVPTLGVARLAALVLCTLFAAAQPAAGLRRRALHPRRASSRAGPRPLLALHGVEGGGDEAGGNLAAPHPLAPLRRLVREQLLQGVEPSANLAAILTVYFVQGSLGLASLATTLYLKDELHLSAAQVAALGGLFAAPWIFKPLYGFVTDSFLLFGSRRRGYLALAGLTASAAYAALATGLPSASATTGTVVLGSLAIAVSDVVADAMVVENVRALAGSGAHAEGGPTADPTAEAKADKETALSGTLQSLCWGSRAVGSLASSYASGALVQSLGVQAVFGLAAVLPLAVVLAACYVDDGTAEAAAAGTGTAGGHGGAAAEADDACTVAASQLHALWEAVRQPSIWQPALFIFCWLATPSSDSAFLFFMTDELHLDSEFLGRIRFVGSLASLGAIVGYQRLLREVPVSRVLLGCTLASAAFGSVQLVLATHANRALGVPDSWLALGDDAVLTALSELAHMPVLVLAARLCPAGVEGTLFATLMSVYNAGGTVGGELGAALTSALGVGTDGDFTRLPQLLLLCSGAKLLPLPFLAVLDRTIEPSSAAGGEEDAALPAQPAVRYDEAGATAEPAQQLGEPARPAATQGPAELR